MQSIPHLTAHIHPNISPGEANHKPTSCEHCELVPAEGYRRHWKAEPKRRAWHVIADGPDLMARLPRQAHFVTVLSYHLNEEDLPATYRGPLYFEVDAPDPSQGFAELRCCLTLLTTEYECPGEAIHVWHSGGRGAHVTIPPVAFGAEAGHPQLPRIYSAMIQKLFPPKIAPSLDRSIYSTGKGRMWRLPNRRRSDTGRYKVPLAMREVLHKPYADLEKLTLRPRKGIFWIPDEEISPCPALVQLYQETDAVLEETDGHRPGDTRGSTEPGGDVQVLLSRCAFIRHCRDDAATLSEPEWFAMVSNVARCTNGAAAVHQLSAPYPGYSHQETDAKIAHALNDAGPHTCAFIQAQGFQGCPPGGCGVKAPVGLSDDPSNDGRGRRMARALRLRAVAEETARRILKTRLGGVVG